MADAMEPEKSFLEERLAKLALYLGVNWNNASFHRVLRVLGTAAEAFENHDLSHLGVNLKPLFRGGLFEEAEETLKAANEKGFKIIIFGDADYPPRLLEIIDPPPVLWLRGALTPEDCFAISLVGARAASPASLKAARELAFSAAKAGLTVVSGLAKGVDAAAHEGALKAGGRTLAVLGCGLNWVYPKDNSHLFEKIPEHGALISEFPPDTRPIPGLFPRRNRIIAGLSLAVVVVEAGERSGSLITARLALEMNREVMALPGPAGSANYRGNNNLIKNGAALVENMADILTEIKPRLLEGLTQPEFSVEAPAEEGDIEALKESQLTAKIKNLTGPEILIMELLKKETHDIDALIRGAGLSAQETSGCLLSLELHGLIERKPSGQYAWLDQET